MYKLINRYYDEDEIDLAEILKTIIKEKKLIFIVTVIFTIFAAGFAFHKINQPKNYGVNISFSEETANKINQYNNIYKTVHLLSMKLCRNLLILFWTILKMI